MNVDHVKPRQSVAVLYAGAPHEEVAVHLHDRRIVAVRRGDATGERREHRGPEMVHAKRVGPPWKQGWADHPVGRLGDDHHVWHPRTVAEMRVGREMALL